MQQRERRDGDFLVDPRRGTIVAAVLLVAVSVMTVLVAVDVSHPPLLGTIDGWGRDLVEPPEAWAARLSEWMKILGGGEIMAPLRIVVAVWLIVRRRWVDLAAWLTAWAVADLLTQILKPGLGRMRPDLADATSFPSGHAKTAAQVSVSLLLTFTSPWRSRAWAWTLAVAWTVAMSLSRMVLIDHYLSDVVAGSLLGAGCAVGAAALLQRARDQRVAPTPPLAPDSVP